jgi:hypothetical protein
MSRVKQKKEFNFKVKNSKNSKKKGKVVYAKQSLKSLMDSKQSNIEWAVNVINFS